MAVARFRSAIEANKTSGDKEPLCRSWGVALTARRLLPVFPHEPTFSASIGRSQRVTRIRHGDGGGIFSNCVIELRLLTHACCERTNNCLRGTNS